LHFHKDFNHKNEVNGFTTHLYNILWGFLFFIPYGKPQLAFRFGEGLGDHLICTVLFHSLAKITFKKCGPNHNQLIT